MPYVNIRIAGTATTEQKADLVARATDAIVQALDKPASAVYVTIDEVAFEDWGVGGELVSERMKKK